MKEIDTLIRSYAISIINNHFGEILEDGWCYCEKQTMIDEAEQDTQYALWVITEICFANVVHPYPREIWKECANLFQNIDSDDTFLVIKIQDKYIKLDYNENTHVYAYNFCERKERTVYYFE